MSRIILKILEPIMYMVILLFSLIKGKFYRDIKIRYGTTDLFTFIMIFIKNEYKHPFNFEPDLIIDGGANIGLASLYFHKKYPKAKIVAIEVEQSNLDLLKKNLSPISNIQIVDKALWFEKTKVYINNPIHVRKKDSFFVDNRPTGNIAIDTITPFELIKENKSFHSILFKIDIESSEKELFAHDDDGWMNSISGFVIETHDRMKPDCKKTVIDKLTKYGFEYCIDGFSIFAQKKH